MQAHADNGRR